MLNGKITNNQHEVKVINPAIFFSNTLQDAEIFAKDAGGKIYSEQTENSLYINYLDVKNCSVIDRTYLIEQK